MKTPLRTSPASLRSPTPSGDPVALAKALSKYAKDNPEVTFKAVVLEGRLLPAKELEALASMPSKEEIYSKLLFLMNAPAQRLVTVMNAVGRDVAVVINQGVEKGKFKDEAASAVITLGRKRVRGFGRQRFPLSVQRRAKPSR